MTKITLGKHFFYIIPICIYTCNWNLKSRIFFRASVLHNIFVYDIT